MAVRNMAVGARVVAMASLCALLALVRAVSGSPDVPALQLQDLLLALAVMALGDISRWRVSRRAEGARSAIAAGLLGLGGVLHALAWRTAAGWVLVTGCFLAAACADQVSAAAFGSRPGRWAVRLGLALLAGFLPALFWQLDSGFADEEFFVVAQALALSGLVLLYLVGQARLDRQAWAREAVVPEARARPLVMAGALVAVLACLAVWIVLSYQRSFYSASPPPFPGVTEQAPFVVHELPGGEPGPRGEDVFRRLADQTRAGADTSTERSGMLALATHELPWAEVFRECVMAEARAGLFVGPAHSIKSVQFLAAVRVYCCARIKQLFPDLFTAEDEAVLAGWLTAINRRALTVEWVDWLYAIAFAKRPEGPYANQEIGAGLLATLEAADESPEELSPRNREYLDRCGGGWNQRFRNTDDSFTYQGQWIQTAFLQSLHQAPTAVGSHNLRLSFEWMALQMPPGGAAFTYNFPTRSSYADIFYLGAVLLREPRYLWLAGQALAAMEAQGRSSAMQPGTETSLDFDAASPTAGTALIYGESGLPNQRGPLAPDKIVFRDGWATNSTFMLVNLRFTGWHRYKATGGIVLLHQDGPLVFEQLTGPPCRWLPAGRAAFRDKRIPRENLNGLLIPRSGMAAVFGRLMGTGSAWAQDPPHYARVETFETLGALDVARIHLDDWNGWDGVRSVYFLHGGLIVVVDAATGPPNAVGAGVSWHLAADRWRDDNTLRLREGRAPADVVFMGGVLAPSDLRPEPGWDGTTQALRVTCRSVEKGRLASATAFLLREWVGAKAESSVVLNETSGEPVGRFVRVSGAAGTVCILQNESTERIGCEGFTTSGRALFVWSRPTASVQVYCIGRGEHTMPAEAGRFRLVAGREVGLAGGARWTEEGGAWRFLVEADNQSTVVELGRLGDEHDP